MAGTCVKAAAKRRLSEPSVQHELEDRDGAAMARQTLQGRRLAFLRREMEAAIGCLTPQKYQEWTRPNHTMTYMAKCLLEEDIYN